MYHNKLYTIKEAKFLTENLKNNRRIIGFTNGCFDLLHPGHKHLLKKAKSICDFLIIGLNSDSSIKTLKGKNRPIENQKLRSLNLSNLNYVDAIMLFDDLTPINLITEILPDILVKGSDYKDKEVIGSSLIIENGGKVEFIDILPDYSTTILINKMKK